MRDQRQEPKALSLRFVEAPGLYFIYLFYGDLGLEVHFRVFEERFSDFLSLLDRVWYQTKTNHKSETMINTFMFMEIGA